MAANPAQQFPNLFAVEGGFSSFQPPSGSAPDAITDLSRSSMTSSGTSLSWTLPANTDNVKVYQRDVTAAGSFSLIETLGAVSSYNVSGLTAENQYEWKVVASNANGDSSDSNVVSGTTTAAASLPTADYFSDNFSTGDLSVTQNGAGWAGQQATSLVNDSGCVVFSAGGSVVDPPNCGFEAREWDAVEGSISMRARFGVDDAFAMQTFSLNQPATRMREIWLRFWMKTPIDYEHVNNSGSSTNNKFLAIWMDGRETNSNGGATVVFQTQEASGSDNVGSVFTVYCWNSSQGNGDIGSSFGDFISAPGAGATGVRDDRGRWQQIVLRIKANDEGVAESGAIQSWRRWQNETDFTLMQDHQNRDIPIPNTGYDGWDTMQIWGGDNSWLADGTEWLMDVFEISTSALVPAGTEGL